MDKVANKLGLGVKGDLIVTLDRLHYRAGNLLCGSVVLSVTESLDFTSLVLHICGKEQLTWTEGGGQAAAVYLREHLHLNEEIVLSADQQSCQPGEYVYPIRFPLTDTLPTSFHVSNCDAGVMSCIEASLSYSATVIMRVKGKFLADMKASKTFAVQQQPISHPVYSLAKSASDEIYLLRLLKKGTCSISAQLPSNVHIAGNTLVVQTRVQNDTSKNMSKLSMMLFEDVTVDLDTSTNKTGGSMCVSLRVFPGIPAGRTIEQVLALPLVTRSSQSRPVSAAVSSYFLTTQYRLIIKCHFHFCHSVSVEFPVDILQKLAKESELVPIQVVLPAVQISGTNVSQLNINGGAGAGMLCKKIDQFSRW